MSRHNLDVVRRALEEVDFRRVDPGDPALEELFDPDVEWHAAQPSLLAASSYRGYEGVTRFWRDLYSAWEEYVVEALEYVDAGDHVVVVARIRARTREITIDEVWSALLTLRDGRIVRFQGFTNREGAFAAQQDVETVRRVIEANRSGPPESTSELVVTLCDPELEFESRLAAVEGATYRGHDGVRRYFADLADAWQEWRTDADEIVELRPGVVVASVTFEGIGKGSGAGVELRSVMVVRLSGGKVVRVHSHGTREEALRAAGFGDHGSDQTGRPMLGRIDQSRARRRRP